MYVYTSCVFSLSVLPPPTLHTPNLSARRKGEGIKNDHILKLYLTV